jgi:hypothetical protein
LSHGQHPVQRHDRHRGSSEALRASVRAELSQAARRVRIRGYDRVEVDAYFLRVIDRLD